jgi:hypothetical protein
MESYDTLTEAINALRNQGYKEDFNLREDCIECAGNNKKLFPTDFKVDKFFRFEDDNSPSEESILYAISSSDNRLKGILVNAYGVYSDSTANDIISMLKMH